MNNDHQSSSGYLMNSDQYNSPQFKNSLNAKEMKHTQKQLDFGSSSFVLKPEQTAIDKMSTNESKLQVNNQN